MYQLVKIIDWKTQRKDKFSDRNWQWESAEVRGKNQNSTYYVTVYTVPWYKYKTEDLSTKNAPSSTPWIKYNKVSSWIGKNF